MSKFPLSQCPRAELFPLVGVLPDRDAVAIEAHDPPGIPEGPPGFFDALSSFWWIGGCALFIQFSPP